MNAFQSALTVEERGKQILRPWIREHAHEGAVVYTTKGALSQELQATFGDVLFNTAGERVWCAELKIEQEWTGNLFLEIWSNRNLDRREDYDRLGQNPGWMFKQRADLLLYYFLDTDDLVAVPMFRLKRWAFGYGDTLGAIWTMRQRKQGRYQQLNDTWGWLVPVSLLEKEVGAKRYHARQLPLLESAA